MMRRYGGLSQVIWVIVIVYILVLVSSEVIAQGGEGKAAPIEINDIDELQNIGNDPGYPLNGNYVLGNDIDANNTATWNSDAGFAPIQNFTGTFDGGGYVITGLTINRPDENNVGLFGFTDDATIENVALQDVNVSGYNFVSGLVSWNDYGSITNCYSTGTISGNQYIGGLVGENDYGNITNCYSTGTILGNHFIGGGLVGWNNLGNITNCYSTGAVSGDAYIGGLVGGNYMGSITNCYSTGAVLGDTYIGGLVSGNYKGSITNCYSTGVVTGEEECVGGLVGESSGSVISCYWNTETSGLSMSAGGTGKTTAEMMKQATFLGWDFVTTWSITEGVTYPWLQERESVEGEGEPMEGELMEGEGEIAEGEGEPIEGENEGEFNAETLSINIPVSGSTDNATTWWPVNNEGEL